MFLCSVYVCVCGANNGRVLWQLTSAVSRRPFRATAVFAVIPHCCELGCIPFSSVHCTYC